MKLPIAFDAEDVVRHVPLDRQLRSRDNRKDLFDLVCKSGKQRLLNHRLVLRVDIGPQMGQRRRHADLKPEVAGDHPRLLQLRKHLV
jgi:hypothetical protein